MKKNRASLYLFGSPRLTHAGKAVEFDTRKATALLAYLAMTRTSHSRDALAALLYPESDQAKARAALRRTLSTLKQALADEWLEIDRETIGLSPDANLSVDVEQFRGHVAVYKEHEHETADGCTECLTSLEKAAEIYHGDFMSGFTLRDSPEFDDWQFFQTESLRRELGEVLGRLVCDCSIRGEYIRAIGHARRWLALDPLDESAHRQLMRLYGWSGQRTAALRQYRECVRLLEQELGVAPLEETTSLYERIETNRLGEPARGERVEASAIRGGAIVKGAISPANSPSRTLPGRRSSHVDSIRSPTAEYRPPASVSYPLVGRSAALATLFSAYDSIHGDGHFLIIEGEAGIGKTRLAEEFLSEVRSRGAATMRARCYEGEMNLAYGPFVEGLRALDLRAGWSASVPAQALVEAARILPELAQQRTVPPPQPLGSPGAQSLFFESVSQVMLAACGTNPPGVLFLDDVQWGDAASLDLLTWLVRRLNGRPLLVLAAWRSEEVAADHRLRQLLAEAQRAGTGAFVHLSRLDREAVAELVRSAAAKNAGAERAGAGQELVERLYRETEGQPFFLVEYLALLASGERTESAEWSLPGGVRDLLRSHLNRVSETARQLLGAGAVVGRSFDYEILRQVSGRNEVETISAIEELIRQGLIVEVKTETGGSELIHDFSHDKLRAVVYEEISLARRRLLHRRAAETLVNRARLAREADALAEQIARHYQLAGEESQAAEYFKRAGEHARSLYANAEALEHFRAALALGYPDAAWLYDAIGDLQTRAGEYGAALISYESVAARLEAGASGEVEAKIAGVYLRRGDWDLAENHFRAALSILGESGPPGPRARIYGDWSLAALRRGSTEQARDLSRRALELAEAAGDRRALAQAHNMLGILARHTGDSDDAIAHLSTSLDLAGASGDPDARSAALNNLALAYQDRGDTARGFGLAEEALALSASQGDRHREAALHNNLADLLHAAGRSEEAMTHLKRAVAIYAEIGVEAGMWQPEIWKLAEW